MIIAPNGEVLANMKNKTGLACAEFDPKSKYYKPAGYGNPPTAHYEYVELGRRPWKYRPAGSAIVPDDATMNYPRVCAWNGYQNGLPAGSMEAFGAAIALDTQEIGFALDYINATFVIKESRIPLEQLLKKFSCHAVMNICIDDCQMTKDVILQLKQLLHCYDCETYVYLTCKDDTTLEMIHQNYPELCLCLASDTMDSIIERACLSGSKKIQVPTISKELLAEAHLNGLHCNVLSAVEYDTLIIDHFRK